MFSTVEDPDYAGHVILEQFQAQVTFIVNFFISKGSATTLLFPRSRLGAIISSLFSEPFYCFRAYNCN
jgi:hypothetical protein